MKRRDGRWPPRPRVYGPDPHAWADRAVLALCIVAGLLALFGVIP